jgi:glycosyltransferase involved in cell wall biosynthesis
LNTDSSQDRLTNIAFFLQDLDGGGAERAIVALAGKIADLGNSVELVIGDAASDYRSEVPASVLLTDFATRSRVVLLIRLVGYLRRRRPMVVMAALDWPNILLAVAAKLSGFSGRIVVSQRAVVAASLDGLSAVRRRLTRFLLRASFRRADAVVSNSHAAAADVKAMLRDSEEKVVTIHNAVNIERIRALAQAPVAEDFGFEREVPVIVSVGSLTPRKDFATLIRAFAIVREERDAHLVIIGKGNEREGIERLIAELGLGSSVSLPGFDANPYRWIARAAVFVSSSTAEGFPNVIAEALGLGRPVVATDCPGDTSELLGNGRWGRLVPMRDAASMAKSILAALNEPEKPEVKTRAADFSPEQNLRQYLQVLLPGRAAGVRSGSASEGVRL